MSIAYINHINIIEIEIHICHYLVHILIKFHMYNYIIIENIECTSNIPLLEYNYS